MKYFFIVSICCLSLSKGFAETVYSSNPLNETTEQASVEQCLRAIKASMSSIEILVELRSEASIARTHADENYADELTLEAIRLSRKNLSLHKWKLSLLFGESECLRSIVSY